MADAKEICKDLESAANTLWVIDDHGDLCRDGVRSTNFLKLIAFHLIGEIEAKGEIGEIADALHKTYVEIAGTKNI